MEASTLKEGTLFHLSQMYVDMEHPEESSLKEPPEKACRKRRPSGAKNKDKVDPREKSHHEHVREELLHAEKQKEKVKGKATERQYRGPGSPRKQDSAVSFDIGDQSQPWIDGSQGVESHFQGMNVGNVHVRESTLDQPEETEETEEPEEPMIYMGVDFGIQNIDDFWYAYISYVTDVSSNGNCGHRSMVILKGMKESQHGQMRNALGVELVANKAFWDPIHAASRPGSWDDLIQQVNYMRKPCTEWYLLDMPFMGLVFATLYNVGLVVMSWDDPLLCLPLRPSTPSLDPPQQIVAMVHVGNHNHWIPVSLQEGSPIPSPTALWPRFCDQRIRWWEGAFKTNLDLFETYCIRNDRPIRYMH